MPRVSEFAQRSLLRRSAAFTLSITAGLSVCGVAALATDILSPATPELGDTRVAWLQDADDALLDDTPLLNDDLLDSDLGDGGAALPEIGDLAPIGEGEPDWQSREEIDAPPAIGEDPAGFDQPLDVVSPSDRRMDDPASNYGEPELAEPELAPTEDPQAYADPPANGQYRGNEIQPMPRQEQAVDNFQPVPRPLAAPSVPAPVAPMPQPMQTVHHNPQAISGGCGCDAMGGMPAAYSGQHAGYGRNQSCGCGTPLPVHPYQCVSVDPCPQVELPVPPTFRGYFQSPPSSRGLWAGYAQERRNADARMQAFLNNRHAGTCAAPGVLVPVHAGCQTGCGPCAQQSWLPRIAAPAAGPLVPVNAGGCAIPGCDGSRYRAIMSLFQPQGCACNACDTDGCDTGACDSCDSCQ
ncbi:MAG: hypothetical protein AAFP90_04910 [Planctomycetota bacterium]